MSPPASALLPLAMITARRRRAVRRSGRGVSGGVLGVAQPDLPALVGSTTAPSGRRVTDSMPAPGSVTPHTPSPRSPLRSTSSGSTSRAATRATSRQAAARPASSRSCSRSRSASTHRWSARSAAVSGTACSTRSCRRMGTCSAARCSTSRSAATWVPNGLVAGCEALFVSYAQRSAAAKGDAGGRRHAGRAARAMPAADAAMAGIAERRSLSIRCSAPPCAYRRTNPAARTTTGP